MPLSAFIGASTLASAHLSGWFKCEATASCTTCCTGHSNWISDHILNYAWLKMLSHMLCQHLSYSTRSYDNGVRSVGRPTAASSCSSCRSSFHRFMGHHGQSFRLQLLCPLGIHSTIRRQSDGPMLWHAAQRRPSSPEPAPPSAQLHS